MAVKTYMFAAGNDGNFGALVDGVDQTAASRTDGWTVAKLGAGMAADFDAGTKQVSGAFTTSTLPSALIIGTTANAFKTPAPLTGTFAFSTWTFNFAVRATVASSQAGKMGAFAFQSVNADGSGATAVAGKLAAFQSSIVTPSTTADVVGVINASYNGTVTLNNEYLFIALGWNITTAGGSNSADVVIRTGQAAAGSRIVTPDFTPAAAEVIPDVGMALAVT